MSFRSMTGKTAFRIGLLLLLVVLSQAMQGCGKIYPEGQSIGPWQACYSEYHDPATVMEKGGWVEKNTSRLFRVPHFKSGAMSYVWLRARFTVDHPEQFTGLSLGRIYDADKVYVNGSLVGERKWEDIQEFHFPRNYSLPPKVLVKGDNDIMIHIGVFGKEYAGILGQVKLLDPKGFSRDKVLDNLLFLHIPLSIIAMLLGLFVTIVIYHALIEAGPLAYVVLGIIFTWVVHLALLFFPIQPLPMEWRIIVLWFCFFANSVLFVLFVQLNFRVLFKNLTWAFVGLTAAGAMWAFFGESPISPDSPGRILGAASALATNALVIFLYIRLRNTVEKHEKIIFWCLAFIPGEIIGLDILNYLYGTRSIPYIHIYSLPFFMLMVVLLQRDSLLRQRHKMKLTTLKLGEEDSIPSREGGFTVTPQVRVKLDELLEFIQANFNRPVTREELSEKAGLSPDYLGRMFKVHTGLKINDYISEVRIREACRLLRENPESRIIDIAFVVGFESLATFNRTFMKIMKKSPTDFRQTLSGSS